MRTRRWSTSALSSQCAARSASGQVVPEQKGEPSVEERDLPGGCLPPAPADGKGVEDAKCQHGDPGSHMEVVGPRRTVVHQRAPPDVRCTTWPPLTVWNDSPTSCWSCSGHSTADPRGDRDEIPGYPTSHDARRQAFERDKRLLRDEGIDVAAVPVEGPGQFGYRIESDTFYLPDLALSPRNRPLCNSPWPAST